MKVGIVTFWQTRDNYGQMLQCYALQQYLQKCECEPFLIKYAHSEYMPTLSERLFFFFANLLQGKWKHLFLKQKKLPDISDNDMRRGFEKFKCNNIKSTDTIYYSLSQLRKKAPIADYYIVGSDQVWSKSLTTDDGKVFYLRFGSKQTKRISYAASFGNKIINPSDNKLLSKRLSGFNSISVREYTGVKYCENAGYKAELVVDPTLLLSKNDYFNLFPITNDKRKQIFLYSLNVNKPEDIQWLSLKEYASDNNLTIVITPSSGYISDVVQYGDDENYQYCTIEEWINNINQSELVVTTSFHGVVFSLIMHTPFVYVPLKGKYSKGNDRVMGLLNSLNLENRIIKEVSTYADICNNEINWDEVEKKLDELRSKSKLFLRNSLLK